MAEREVEQPAPSYLFTVFTPTFNRARTLSRVYDSLDSQTFRDFEWLVVDDGSTDGTTELMERWQAASSFPIRYVRQPNLGKHVAFNRAVGLARGSLFLTLDSDDACVTDALERLERRWSEIPPEIRDTYFSVTGLCVDQDGNLVGDRFPADVLDATSVELVYRYHVRGEKWGFSRTDVLRQFPYPTAPGMKFVPESLVWDAIGTRYRTRYVNEVLRVYWIRRDGADPGSRPDPRADAPGLALWHAFILDHHLRWVRHAPLQLAASAVHFVRFSLLAGDSPSRQFGRLGTWPARLAWFLALPLGVLVGLRDLRRATAKRLPVAGAGQGTL